MCDTDTHVSFASDSSETIVVIIKLGTITASDMLMQHVFIILTLTFIQGHIFYIYHENHKCLIISETVQAIPISYAVKIV